MNTRELISEEDAIGIIATAFNEDAADINANTQKDELDGWDSMGILLLMAEFDEQFGLTISEDKLEALVSINDIFELLKSADILG